MKHRGNKKNEDKNKQSIRELNKFAIGVPEVKEKYDNEERSGGTEKNICRNNV